MKKIISGKRYDTDTAVKKAEWWNGLARNDFGFIEETLYQKKTGEFFLFGDGGANTQYAERVGNNSWCGGTRIMPLTYKEAQKWGEKHLEVEEYETIFGEVKEDESKAMVTVSIPAALADKLKKISAITEKTQSEIIADVIRAMNI